MSDPVTAPTSSVSSEQVKSVPTLEDRLAKLEEEVSSLAHGFEHLVSVWGSELKQKVEQMAVDVADHHAWMKGVRAK